MDWLCPHYCRGCGQLGELICGCCKNDILSENLEFRQRTQEVLVVGKRDGLLNLAIKEYKYGPVRAFGGVLAELLVAILRNELRKAKNVVIVPLPTIAKHIRQRGFDHAMLLGRKVAKLGGWKLGRVLERANNTVQVGQDRETRERQARAAYRVRSQLDSEILYILLDDVWTTGASMRAAEEELKRMGAKKIKKIAIAVSEND